MKQNCSELPYCPFALTVIAASWILIALFVGETQALRLLPPKAVPALVWSLTAALLLAFWKSAAFRSFVDGLSVRTLLSVHLTRFVGFYFLYLGGKGELPRAMAMAAEWGDIVVALGAALLILKPAPRSVAAWNILGLADIVCVVLTVARELSLRPGSMDAFLSLPLSFLPTLVVPVIISTHLVLLLRLPRSLKEPSLATPNERESAGASTTGASI